MNIETMVHNANQIAAFFEAWPEEEAAAAVEDHLRKFWEPRMRTQILEYAKQGGTGLSRLASAGISRLMPA